MDLSFGRLLTLLELLQAHRHMSAREIAGRLEVEPRTVRRYIQGLQEMGIPIEGERGPAGGYHLRPGYKLPPLMFGDDEALAVVLGLLAVQRLGLISEGPAVEGAIAKLDRVLPSDLRTRIQAMKEVVELGLPRRVKGSPGSAATVLQLTSAARDGQRVKLGYQAASGESTDRLVDPYGVAIRGNGWYLVAFDHLRQDLRTFRLDRIRSCDTTREHFDRPAGFDVGGHVERALASVPWPFMATVRLDLTVDEARRRIGPTVGVLEPDGPGTRLRVGGDDAAWIARFLAELGCDFEVIEPVELKDALVELSKRLDRMARATPPSPAATPPHQVGRRH